jgi:signal transduction histidine kinase
MNMPSHFVSALSKTWTRETHRGAGVHEKKIAIGFAFALVLLVVIGVVSYQATIELREAELAEAQIESTLVTLEAISSQLKDAEIGHHAYLITGDERYLAAYYLALRTVAQELGDLRALTAHDPSFQRKIGFLESLVAAKFAALGRAHDVRKSQGFEAAAPVIWTHNGKQIMDDALRSIGELKQEQSQALPRETGEAEAPQTLLLGIIFGSAFAMLLAAFVIRRDITERVRAYQMLERRVAERTYEIERRRQVAEGLRDTLTILNSSRPLDEILSSIVIQACRLLETDAGAVYRLDDQEQLLSIQATFGLDADDAALNIPVGWGAMGQVVLTRQPVVVSNVTVTPQDEAGSTPDLELRAWMARPYKQYSTLLAVPLLVKDAVYGAIVLYYHDPREFSEEEREMAVAFSDQAALAIENARLRLQAEQMAVAAERSRLARDLHDAVTQTLFSTSLIADVLPRLWDRDPAEARQRLSELRLLTRGALAEMRTLLLELRPATLTEVGLCELLRQLAEATISRARFQVDLTVEGQCQLPADVQIALYRIAQEALNNVARHAGASRADVCLRCQPGQVELRISDDGQGFDPANVTREHLGLGIMRERAEAIEATLRIDSQPGRGTHIVIIWPDRRAAPGGQAGGEKRPGRQRLAMSGGGHD